MSKNKNIISDLNAISVDDYGKDDRPIEHRTFAGYCTSKFCTRSNHKTVMRRVTFNKSMMVCPTCNTYLFWQDIKKEQYLTILKADD